MSRVCIGGGRTLKGIRLGAGLLVWAAGLVAGVGCGGTREQVGVDAASWDAGPAAPPRGVANVDAVAMADAVAGDAPTSDASDSGDAASPDANVDGTTAQTFECGPARASCHNQIWDARNG